jgi:hypothetical protein
MTPFLAAAGPAHLLALSPIDLVIVSIYNDKLR